MKRENNVLQGFFLIVIFVSIIWGGCLNKGQLKKDTVRLQVFSPSNCRYDFYITEDSLYVKIIDGLFESGITIESDELVLNEKVAFDTKSKDKAHHFINAMKIKQFKINKLQQTDAYQYEVYVNDLLKGREFCCDVEVNMFLRDCLPFIANKKNACSGFFDMVAKTKD